MRTVRHSLSRTLQALLLAAATACVALLASPLEAVAQDDSNPAVYWRLERERQEAAARRVIQRPTRLTRGVAPRPGFTRELPAGGQALPGAADAPSGTDGPAGAFSADASQAPAAPPAPIGPPFVIAVFGDNVGQLLAQGLADAYAGRGNVTVLRRTRDTSGLVREDFHDWPKAAQDFLNSDQKIDMAVMMVGSNDRQSMRDGAASVETLSMRWRELYAGRASAFAEAFRRKNVPLVWVGMPVMKNERLSADLVQLNEIYREAVTKAGGSYVDVWEAFADERNRFALHGPDVNGHTTRLRTGDGVHFTRAGARKLAFFVEGDVKKLLDQRKGPEPLIADAPAIAPLAPGVPAPAGLSPAIEAAIGVESAPVVPTRPVAGPILPLNAAIVSPGGELATRAAIESVTKAVEAAASARTGRADDFSWPRR